MKKSILTFMLIFAILGCYSRKDPPPQAQKKEGAGKITTRHDPPRFNGERAFELLKKQTEFGPRVPGTKAHRSCMNYLRSYLSKYADKVELQEFTHAGYGGSKLRMANIFGSFNSESKTRILLLAHWDSRPWADQDPQVKNRNMPVPGANDGASGVGVLMEIARHLKSNPPATGVDILFTDGEDYGKEGDTQNYLLGAKYFSKNMPAGYKPDFGILIDMVGDKELELMRERYSIGYAPQYVDLIWNTARDLGVNQFSDEIQNWVMDDHLPLNEAGIPTVDIIDFNYPDGTNRFWHTLEDLPDKCSPSSLAAVGDVLLSVIYNYGR